MHAMFDGLLCGNCGFPLEWVNRRGNDEVSILCRNDECEWHEIEFERPVIELKRVGDTKKIADLPFSPEQG